LGEGLSRIFGPIRQNGYVVDDLEQAVDHWLRVLGVGPFFWIPSVTFETYQYRGTPSSPELRVAVANSGDLQIELIEQVNDEPSFYREFLQVHGPGLQHLSVWSDRYDADIRRARALGIGMLSDGVMSRANLKFSMFDTSYHAGTAMEVLDYTEAMKERFAIVRDAAIGWDGDDPIRHHSS
jgi:Glyoxalase/Bleomycin resistance protein/Dioxygenase superfamily